MVYKDILACYVNVQTKQAFMFVCVVPKLYMWVFLSEKNEKNINKRLDLVLGEYMMYYKT